MCHIKIVDKRFLSLRTAAAGLNVQAKTFSRWLSTLGIPETGRNEHKFQLNHPTVVALALCAQLSAVRALDFVDPNVWNLLRFVIKGEAEEDLRQAIVGISSGQRRRMALTGADKLVMQHHYVPANLVSWEGQGVVQHWCVDGPLTYISLAPLYDQVDALFAVKKDGKEEVSDRSIEK